MLQRSIAVALAATLCLHPSSAAAATPLGAESPQALVARLNQAVDKNDFGEAVACLDKQSRVEMSTMVMLGAVMMVGFMAMGADPAEGMAGATKKTPAAKADAAAKAAKAKVALTAVLKKHGLPDLMDEKAANTAGDSKDVMGKTDHPLFVRDIMGILQSIADKKEGAGEEKPFGGQIPDVRQVTDYKMTGDTATAKAVDGTIKFVKADGRWLLKMEQKPKAG